MVRRLYRGALGLALAVGLALAGCTEGGPAKTQSPAVTTSPAATATASASDTAAPGPSATPGQQTNPVALERVTVGGALRVGVAGLPASWNPLTSTDAVAGLAASLMSPQLYVADATGALHWNADWLVSDPVAQTTTVTTVSYDLRAQAVWGDGTPVGVADFTATWQTCRASTLPWCAGRGFDQVASITGGAGTPITVTYAGIEPDWRQTFARGPLRAASDPTAGAPTDPWDTLAGHVGAFAGPFRYAMSTATSVTFVRNPTWWGTNPKLDTITLVVVAPDHMGLAYLNGDIDAFWVDQANVFALTVGTGDLQVRQAAGPATRWLAFSCGSGPLADATVRQALVLGVDRAALAASDLAGFRGTATTPNNPIWRTDQPGYADLAAKGADPKAAGVLLDGAGYIAGPDGTRSKGGRALTLTFLVPRGDTVAENEAFALRVQLAGLGIGLTLTYGDPAAAAAETYNVTAMTLDDPTTLAIARQYAAPNPWGYADPGVTTLITAALAAKDQTSQRLSLVQAAKQIWVAPPLLPLYEVPEVLMSRPTLANYGPDGLADTVWTNVGWAG